jgi:hypothetical protein
MMEDSAVAAAVLPPEDVTPFLEAVVMVMNALSSGGATGTDLAMACLVDAVARQPPLVKPFLAAVSRQMASAITATALCESTLANYCLAHVAQGQRVVWREVGQFLVVPEMALRQFAEAAARQGCALVLFTYAWKGSGPSRPLRAREESTDSMLAVLSKIAYRSCGRPAFAALLWRWLLQCLAGEHQANSSLSRVQSAVAGLRTHLAEVAEDPELKSVFHRILSSDSGIPRDLRLLARLLAHCLSLALVEGDHLRLQLPGEPKAPLSSFSQQSLATLQVIVKGGKKSYAPYAPTVQAWLPQLQHGLELYEALAHCNVLLSHFYGDVLDQVVAF